MESRSVQDSFGFGDHRNEFEALVQLGRDLQARACYNQALACYKKAIQTKHAALDQEPQHVQALFAEVLFDVGVIHMQPSHENPYNSLQALHVCLDLRRKCFGSKHPAVASVLYKLAIVYQALDQLNTALDLLLEASAIFLWSDPKNPAQAKVWKAIGQIQEALGQLDDSESSYEEASAFMQMEPRQVSQD